MTLDVAEFFSLGSLVMPAVDSSFYSLTLKFEKSSVEHVGLIVEGAKNKSKIYFPGENICLWLGHDEIANFEQLQDRDPESKKIFQRSRESVFSLGMKSALETVILLNFIVHTLKAKTIAGFEKGQSLSEIWNTPDLKPSDNYKGSCLYFGVTVGELFYDQVKNVSEKINKSLISFRILPAGLSKIEISFFLKMS